MSNSQIVRMENGATISVRTGTVQGIGPQGPTGATGPKGEKGDTGPQGLPGPTGGVAQASSAFTASSQSIALTTVTSNYPTLFTNVSFGTVVRDELSTQSSTANFVFQPGSDYNCVVQIRFFKQAAVNGTGFRAVQIVYNSVVVQELIDSAVSLTDTISRLAFGIRSTSGTDILNIRVAHNDTAALNITGNFWVNKTGAGQQGIQGVQGIQGIQGDPGAPSTVAGPPGSPFSSTSKISDISGSSNPA